MNLGIGAKTDTTGDQGFSETSRNFHGVLASLKAAHEPSDKSSKKDKKRRKKDKKKEKDRSESSGSGITLSSKRVTAGHARKMREAKDLTKKSAEDMAAIFGVRVEEYQNNSVWGRLSSLSTGEEKKEEDSSSHNKSEKKERKKKDKKKRKKKDTQNEDSDGGDRKRRKKTRQED